MISCEAVKKKIACTVDLISQVNFVYKSNDYNVDLLINGFKTGQRASCRLS